MIDRPFSFPFLLLLILVWTKTGYGQDLPFSQFLVNPILTNPAKVGSVENDFRFSSNYKNQWRSISEPYKTIAFAYDMAFYQDIINEKYLGMGAMFFTDKAGVTGLNLNLYNLSLSYHTKTDRYNSIGMGLSANYGRRSIDLSKIRWESQHNGNNYDPSLESGEAELSERYGYWDFGGGIIWNLNDPNSGYEIEAGISVLHLNQPKQSFIDVKNERLSRNYQLHASSEIYNRTYSILPQLIISRQRNIFSFIAGGMIKLNPDEPSESKYTDFNVASYFSFGGFYRYRDAVIIKTAYVYKRNISFGLSYDVTLSSLRKYNRSLGGFEFSLVYDGVFQNDKIKVRNKGVKEKDKINLRKDDRNL